MDTITISKANLSQQLLKHWQKLARIERLFAGQKETLTLKEASSYSGVSKGYLYKLTSRGRSLEGKIIFFDKVDLDSWLKRNRALTIEEIEQHSTAYVIMKPAKKGGMSR